MIILSYALMAAGLFLLLVGLGGLLLLWLEDRRPEEPEPLPEDPFADPFEEKEALR